MKLIKWKSKIQEFMISGNSNYAYLRNNMVSIAEELKAMLC